MRRGDPGGAADEAPSALQSGPPSVLVVDDDEANREYLATLVEALGYTPETAAGGEAALQRLSRSPRFAAVILDVLMPEIDGVEMLRRYRSGGGRAPVVMCSALEEGETVVRAMRAGAADYLTKPFNAEELREVLERVAATPSSCRTLEAPRPHATSLGSSAAMRAVDELIERIADADVPVLITGESGVGKDVVAHEIHARSARSRQVFVKINCAALPGELLESELFGHERGSFTGADRAKPGQFELAHGGTLFLDEIGEMPVTLQAKLLQALQDGEFYRVGGQRKISVDARVIVATNVDLARAIERGAFREDLYYRLNVVQVAIPPLRDRREDIPGLLQLFIERYGKRYGRSLPEIPREVMERFATYDFPGNIRELENLVRRLIVLRDPRYVLSELNDRPPATAAPLPALAAAGPQGHFVPGAFNAALVSPFNTPSPLPPAVIPTPPEYHSISAAHSPSAIAEKAGSTAAVLAVTDDYRIDLKDLGRKAAHAAEREAIVIMLAHTCGDKREAADRLGISYKAILYKIRDFGIGRPRAARRLAAPARPPALEPAPAAPEGLIAPAPELFGSG